MKNRLWKIERWIFPIMVSVLFFIGVGTADVYANIGDSKDQVEDQFGPAKFVQDDTKRIWNWQEWQKNPHGRTVAYGYRNNAGGWPSTCWVEYNRQGKVVKEITIFDAELRIRDFPQYYKTVFDEIMKENSVVFTKRSFLGDRLGVVVQTDHNRLNYIQFFMVPDSTKINMHSKIYGFEIIEITSKLVKRNLADKNWRKTDNYFENKLYFSEELVLRTITDLIVIHHSAKDDMSLADIHELHLTKGWAGIGYHKVILSDGTVQDGRPEETVGAHALGANPHSIGIVVDGNFEVRAPTAGQIDSLVKLTRTLMEKYDISLEHVVPHRDVTQGTLCPGEQFPWAEFIHRLENKDEDFDKPAVLSK